MSEGRYDDFGADLDDDDDDMIIRKDANSSTAMRSVSSIPARSIISTYNNNNSRDFEEETANTKAQAVVHSIEADTSVGSYPSNQEAEESSDMITKSKSDLKYNEEEDYEEEDFEDDFEEDKSKSLSPNKSFGAGGSESSPNNKSKSFDDEEEVEEEILSIEEEISIGEVSELTQL